MSVSLPLGPAPVEKSFWQKYQTPIYVMASMIAIPLICGLISYGFDRDGIRSFYGGLITGAVLSISEGIVYLAVRKSPEEQEQYEEYMSN